MLCALQFFDRLPLCKLWGATLGCCINEQRFTLCSLNARARRLSPQCSGGGAGCRQQRKPLRKRGVGRFELHAHASGFTLLFAIVHAWNRCGPDIMSFSPERTCISNGASDRQTENLDLAYRRLLALEMMGTQSPFICQQQVSGHLSHLQTIKCAL